MDEAINNILLDELFEAHGFFDNTINEMKEKNIPYEYANVLSLENGSYQMSYNAILRMNDALKEYKFLKEENEDYFSGERRIILKYIMLYFTSIIMIKIFSKTLSSEKISEIWYALIGIVLGSTNAAIINKNLNIYRYGNRENREFINRLATLKEEYDKNFEIARREIGNISLLNKNMQKEIPSNMILIKK